MYSTSTIPQFAKSPDNVFNNTYFAFILFGTVTQIERIHSNAFTSIAANIEEVFIYRLKSNNVTHIREMFDALSVLTNISYVQLINSDLTSVPANAFKNISGIQQKLQMINFEFGNVTSIANYEFYELANITNVYLDFNKIN